MSTSDSWEDGVINLILRNTDFTLLGDAGGLRGSATAGSIYIGLYTADPGESGNQATNEVAYTTYARVGVARSGAGWNASSGGTSTNAADITFPIITSGGPVTLTHVGIGTSSAGTGKLMYSGAFTTPKTAQNGDTPTILAGSLSLSQL